ncbi:UDP-glucuronate:xylan alpha-glucuronosyltransferase 2-like isoform X1 [Tripterygium wilfordii]|uniref:UDP-glucuronate:xylan alpha-glucuronosyltransferase 2-like isoform X1 n=1 Tax=Tripterygium wilfordii TaxID=458696 RepID=UPI0018F81E19|nr:UDP-glucuronate:xylan alpha-glucuronosyltransferase 2-like isoform X1 [Tripterygium wilfordii]
MMRKAIPKALFVKISLFFLAVFLVIYAALLLRPSSSTYFENAATVVTCSLRECNHKLEKGFKMKAVLEETQVVPSIRPTSNVIKLEVPSFMDKRGKRMKIGMVNMEEEDASEWRTHGEVIPIKFERVSEIFKWKDLFPEWIDEEEENDGPTCPEMPMPDFPAYESMDIIVAKLPCNYPKEGWSREVLRLQAHLVVANMAVKKGKRDWNWRTKVLMLSKCRPMLELFRCDDLVRREGDWWFYQPEMARLEQKVSLPAGSCKLALPLWGQGIDEVYDLSKIKTPAKTAKREAYVTVIHSSEAYVCGAITLAQSLLRTGTKIDLILLMDKSISENKREALAAAGWKIRFIKRIRNPKAEKNAYNEYNYSKFRLWQLTDYDKLVFIDSDIIVLRNLDILFKFPQMSASGNDVWIFNSGVMVIEPSNCTFKILMNEREHIVPYNGGDQGFLNEVFVWWHRLPRRMNFLKNFWANTSAEASVKNQLFGADPPKLYAIHYLGWKPWLCYRDYDCNWDVSNHRVYASDLAHERWWKVHDSMDEKLQRFCGLSKQRKTALNRERKKARIMGFSDRHWNINITDPRRKHLV